MAGSKVRSQQRVQGEGWVPCQEEWEKPAYAAQLGLLRSCNLGGQVLGCAGMTQGAVPAAAQLPLNQLIQIWRNSQHLPS